MKEVLLIGNPNTGKTTLFNSLTKSNEHIGNWHGVTVEEKRKRFTAEGQTFELIDLPGIYSLTPLSFEEEVATNYVLKNSDMPIINICDINNIQRNLYLTLQLIELNANIILAINTMGKTKRFNEIDLNKLKTELGIEVVLFDADNKTHLAELKKKIVNLGKKKSVKELPYISKFNKTNEFKSIKENFLSNTLNADFCALKCLENDKNFQAPNFNGNAQTIQEVAEMRYEYISRLCKICVKKVKNTSYGESKLDKIILNRWLCLPIFLGLMLLVFYLTFFSVGAYLSDFLSNFIQNTIGKPIVNFVSSVCKIPWVIGLFEDGIIAGTSSLLSFLPQIVLLFLFLSILEDSGYLARIAFSFEDIFSKLGLSGKSVYTLLMGFGCSATAVLTARNMEDKNSKIKTAMLTPYMSCSAKLPIYAVLGGAFFGASNVLIVFMLYILGVVVALSLSVILEKTSLKSKNQSFILEFPPYRLPSIKRVLNIISENLKQFFIRIGSLLFAVNIIVWLLGSFSFSFKYVAVEGGMSILQSIGKIIAPIFSPLGFGNWGASSALIAGLVAKEVIVSSIAIFNGINVKAGDMQSQVQTSVRLPSSAVFFTPASALSFMVFCLIYMPCVSTMAVLKKEIGTKWTIISIIIELGIAYVLSFIVFNMFGFVEKHGMVKAIILSVAILVVGTSLYFLLKHIFGKKKCKGCKGTCNGCYK